LASLQSFFRVRQLLQALLAWGLEAVANRLRVVRWVGLAAYNSWHRASVHHPNWAGKGAAQREGVIAFKCISLKLLLLFKLWH
jgi:hypothetical protein